MKCAVSGGTGFIGRRVVDRLLRDQHYVGVWSRQPGKEKRAAVASFSWDPLQGEPPAESLNAMDAVIHLAFNHDFSKFQENCETDRRVIEALGSVLEGSDRPLIVTSGTAMAISEPGVPSKENDPILSSKVMPRALSEEAADSFAACGVRVIIVRLPQVHNTEKQGLVTHAIQIAREKGVSAYVGDGQNRWPAAHRLDVARLYRLALEKGTAATYHAVDEEGISIKEIAEVIGKGLTVPVVSLTPEEAQGHFGWLAMFVGRERPASGTQTRMALGWEPTGPGMIEDLKNMRYA